ncbi:MAG: glycosyltransferase [Caulobacteraceae bacterium]|nr:glycosyltransferase [Caulobacter sp.]
MQWASGATVSVAIAAALAFSPRALLLVLHHAFFAIFALGIAVRLAALLRRRPSASRAGQPTADAPGYTVIVPLYDEAEVVPDLLRNLGRLDYPRERLQVLIALEADDLATQQAVRTEAPAWMEVVVCPPGEPRTKPRACNAALHRATGEFVVVYDAEDAPDPLQLREAATRFAASSPSLACLQAPLRVTAERPSRFERQFALEYAAQFDVMLPALARWGLPFPLGGTSNHFRRAALEAIGGWDAWNVTEDADLGMRLAASGLRTGMLSRPTWETPPDFNAWFPQRARWIKGYMQTWGVHMRTPFAGGWRRFAALQLTLGYAVLSAVMHGPLAMTVAAAVLVAAAHFPGPLHAPQVEIGDALLCVAGWLTGVGLMAEGARRAGSRMRLIDAALAPAYWPLQSLAAGYALHQLITKPFHWDKTRHRRAASNARLAAAQRSGVGAATAAVCSAAPEGA